MKTSLVADVRRSRSEFVLCMLLILFCNALWAQKGGIHVVLKDAETAEVIPFANLVVYDSTGKQVRSTTTNIDGEALIKDLPKAIYSVKGVYVGYQAAEIKAIPVKPGKISYVQLGLSNNGVDLEEVEVLTYAVPLVDPEYKSGQTITREDYQNLAVKEINSVQIRGARSRAKVSAASTNNPSPSGSQPPHYYPQETISAGKLTAGELNDFKKWDLWKGYTEPRMADRAADWNMKPGQRYVLQVTNTLRQALPGLKVSLLSKNGSVLWNAVTDNTGKAELWSDFSAGDADGASIVVNHQGKQNRLNKIKPFNKGINFMELDLPCSGTNQVDIFVAVDATSSMDDEIAYLQAELQDVLGSIQKRNPEMDLRTASLFYRCPGNEYETRACAFSAGTQETIDFIRAQRSGEGGVESVEVAMDKAINDFSWREGATARLLFMVMDEPPGKDPAKVASLHKTMRLAAAKGIRIIPVVASGGAAYQEFASMEYLMRCMALATNGTYVFLTNDSGIGNSHQKPVTPSYDVERLNALLGKIIDDFSKNKCDLEAAHEIQAMKDSLDLAYSQQAKQDSILATAAEATRVSRDSSIVAQSSIVNRKSSIKIYPNPCASQLHIETNAKVSEVYLCDANGKILELATSDTGRFMFDVSLYPAGLYLVKLGEQAEAETGKLIVQR